MKRLISLSMVFVMAFCTCINAFADRSDPNSYHIGEIKNGVVTDSSQKGVSLGTIEISSNTLVYNLGYIGYDDGDGKGYLPITTGTQSRDRPTIEWSSNRGSDAIKSIELTTDSSKSYYIKLTLNDMLRRTSDLDFRATIRLKHNGKRLRDLEVAIDGTVRNKEQTVGTGDDYINVSDGNVIYADSQIGKLQIFLDKDETVSLVSRMTKGRKHYASYSDEMASNDERIYDRYGQIVYFHHIQQVNLDAAKVKFEYSQNLYAYAINSSGNLVYVGRTREELPFHNKFFIAESQIKNIGKDGADDDSSASSSNSSSTTSSGGATSSGSTALTQARANEAAKSAASTAKANGLSTATVTIRDVESASRETLVAMAKTAGMTVRFNADILNAKGNAVDIRLSLNPANATKDLKLQASSYSAQAKATKAFFEKWFSNKLLCISMTHQGSFGQTVQIAAKISTLGMDTKKLNFYSYNRATNQYTKITTPNYSVDKNGFIHFSSTYGGDIVISEGALIRR